MAEILGIDALGVRRVTWVIGIASAGLMGLVGLVNPFSPYAGTTYLITAFSVAILGGMGSMVGTIVAGFIVGMTESLFSIILPSQITPVIAFLLIIIALLVRPEGLFSRGAQNKHPGKPSILPGYYHPGNCRAGPPVLRFYGSRLRSLRPDLRLPLHSSGTVLEPGGGASQADLLGHAAFFGLGAFATSYGWAGNSGCIFSDHGCSPGGPRQLSFRSHLLLG